MYEIKTENFSKDEEIFEFSNYYDDWNQKFVGKMKDETAGVTFKQFGGFKPNLYSSVKGA